MAFDLDAYRAAHRPWSFTFRGRAFGARHVSSMDVLDWQERIGKAKRERHRIAATRWLLRRAFPWRFSYLIRGDPVALILGLEPQARGEVLQDFFACLWGRRPTDPQQNRTNGTHSSRRTQPQTA